MCATCIILKYTAAHLLTSSVHLTDWAQLLIQTFSTRGGNCYSQRKQEFQTSLVETTFDLKALAPDLQQVETVSFQPVGPSVRGSPASTLSPLDKYYHFAEEYSDKHGVDCMWGLAARVIAGVNAVSGTRTGSEARWPSVENKPNTCFAPTTLPQHRESDEKWGRRDKGEFIITSQGRSPKNSVSSEACRYGVTWIILAYENTARAWRRGNNIIWMT